MERLFGKKDLVKLIVPLLIINIFTAVFSVLVMGAVYLERSLILNGIFGRIEPDVMYNCNLYLLIVSASIPMIALYNAGVPHSYLPC